MKEVQDIINSAVHRGELILNEFDSKRILSAYGIPVVQEQIADDLGAARSVALRIGYPVVLKAVAPSLSHKTEKGLVELGIANEEDLFEAHERLSAKIDTIEKRFLVQKMIQGDREFVIGLIRDPHFGPCVMFGLGGIYTEIIEDVVFRMAPLSRQDAREMMGEIKGRKILGRIRGLAEVDTESLCDCLCQIGEMGLKHPNIREIDVNPLVISGARPVAVDSLVVLEESSVQSIEEAPADRKKKVADAGGLERFFAPRSVAVIGATSTPHKPGNDVIQNILANKYEGNLYLVNPKGGTILGHKVYRAIEELPENIDLAISLLKAQANLQAIRECSKRGIKAIVLAASGFAEVDENGQQLQDELQRVITESGVRVMGPNTSGHISTSHHFTSSFFPLGAIPKGGISYVAQTGNFATHTMRYITSGENYGVARVVGLGNKVDLEESEVLEYYGDDPETKAIFIYLESFRKPRQFLDVAKNVTREKPVILLKGGLSEEGARAAQAHTAALASNKKVIEGALKQAGVVLIHKYSHLFLTAKALAAMPLPRGNRVSFLAPSGAMLVVLTDLCRLHWGLEVPSLEEASRQKLQDISPDYIRMRNPVDIWPSASAKGVEYAYREGMNTVLRDPNIDAVVPVLLLTKETGIPSLDFIPELAKQYQEKPIYVTFTGDKKYMDAAKSFLEPKGIPTFLKIEEPFEVLSILARSRKAFERP